jgi:adenylate cyclase 8
MILLISLLVMTVILVASSILVMAEEFKSMPTYLQHTSSMLVHNKKHRTVFICGVISLMTLTSVIGVLTCSITVRPYPEVMVLERQQQEMPPTTSEILLPIHEKLIATTSRSSLDHLILTFLEAALSDEEQKTVSSAENNTLENNSSSNIELKLMRVVNKLPGRSRKEFFRFYRSMLGI